MRENQTLEHITVSVLQEVGRILREDRFDLLLVQGDTTTSMAAALAAFYCGVRIGHVEAGLRTFDKQPSLPRGGQPEDHRFGLGSVLRPHRCRKAAPARRRRPRGAHRGDGKYGDRCVARCLEPSYSFAGTPLEALPFDSKRIVLVTAHRRESFGDPFESLCRGLRELALKYKDQIVLVYPVHRNPNVRQVVNDVLSGIDNVLLIDPLDYMPLVHLMKRTYMVLTDSGGLQEEAPSLGKPVLVLRKVTERPEGVAAGTVKVIGTDAARHRRGGVAPARRRRAPTGPWRRR